MVPLPVCVKAEIEKCGSENPDYRNRARAGCVEKRQGAHWCFYDRHMQDKAVSKTISAD